MLKFQFKLFLRGLFKNKLFSFINITGLAISMTISLFAISLIYNLSAFDSFHEKEKSIYRVDTKIKYEGYPLRTEASTTLALMDGLQNNFPEIVSIAAFKSRFEGVIKGQKEALRLDGLYANENIFDVFSFEIIAGSESALSDPNSLILTESSALRIFNDTNVVGKLIPFTSGEVLQVGAILKDIPKNSHIQFESLVSLNTLIADNDGAAILSDWDDRFTNYLYVQCREDASIISIEARLKEIGKSAYAEREGVDIHFELEALNRIALGGVDNNPIGFVFPTQHLDFIMLLVLIVIICAAFNYTNLSLSRAFGRTKEVGTRKALGAKTGQVFGQFIGESILTTYASLALAYLLFYLLKDEFIPLIPTGGVISLGVNWQVIVLSFAMATVLGLAGGFFPAYWFSRLRVLSILKNNHDNGAFKNQNVRKTLLTIQLAFSLIFINGAMIVNSQYDFIKEKDLGYETDNIYNLNLQGEDFELIKSALVKVPGVAQVSQSEFVTNSGSAAAYYGYYDTPEDSAYIFTVGINTDYLALHDYRFLAGENFDKAESAPNSVIVNETLVEYFGMQSPQNALGEVINYKGGLSTIIGVVEDFHYERLNYGIRPFAFMQTNNNSGFANIKVEETVDKRSVEARMEEAWASLFPDFPFLSTPYQEYLDRSSRGIVRMSNIVSYIAVIAIFISSLGLLGLVTFEAQMKIKELTIRKVLGADFKNLAYLLSKSYFLLLLLASAIAIPITNWYFDKNLLQSFAFHIDIGVVQVGFGPVLLFVILTLFLGAQIRNSLRSNTLSTLRKE